MKNDWIDIELGKICQKVSKVNRRDVEENATFQYLDIGGIDNKANKIISTKSYSWSIAPSRAQQIVDVDDILFSTVRTYLRNIAKVEDKSLKGQICSTGFTVIRAKKDAIIPSYLFAYVLYEGFLQPLSELQTGSSYPAVRDRDVFSQKIPFPPLPEQRAIVSKIEELFSELDHSIASFKAAKAKLEIYRQAVLKKAFDGGFTEEWREKKGINFNSLETQNVKNFSESIQYGFTASSTSEPVGVKFLRITDIQENKVDWNSVPNCEIDEHQIEKYLLKNGDLVFARTGATVGKSYLIQKDPPKSVFASYLIRIRFPESINKKFVWSYFQSPLYWNQIKDKQVGTGQPNVNGTRLGEIQIPICSIEEQFQIVQEIETRLSVADKLAETIQINLKKSEALRQSILKKAFEGQLLTDAELEACRKEADWEPAEKLMERILEEKKKK